MTEEEKQKIIEELKLQKAYAHKINNLQIKMITGCALNLIQKQDTEINKLKEELDITKTNYEILQGEMDRIGIDTLHLEAGSSTDDVIDEINKLKNVIDKTTDYIEELTGSCPYDTFDYQVRDCENECKDQMAECWKEYFMKEDK